MTTRIFIRGDVGHLPNGCEIYDADTMQKLMVKSLTMKAEAGHATTATMVIIDKSNNEVRYDVYLTHDPWGARRGTVLYQMEHLSTVRPDVDMREEKFCLYGFRSMDGMAVRDTSLDMRAVHEITDCSRYKDQLDGKVRDVLAELRSLVASTLLAKFGPQIPEPAAAAPRVTCPECFGTGYQKGFGAPCSRGCAAP